MAAGQTLTSFAVDSVHFLWSAQVAQRHDPHPNLLGPDCRSLERSLVVAVLVHVPWSATL